MKMKMKKKMELRINWEERKNEGIRLGNSLTSL